MCASFESKQQREQGRLDGAGSAFGNVHEVVSIFAKVLAGSSGIAGVGILCFQILGWAKTGFWQEVMLSDVLHFFGMKLMWVYSPTDWVGIAGIVRFFFELPASMYLILVVPCLIWKLNWTDGR